ncbi:MAG: hypothetical protein ACYCTH_09480, partial [Cellulomonas sp.]
MKLKKLIASVVALTVTGFGAVTLASSASADTTKTVTSSVCVPVEGQPYIAPTYETVPNPDYKPAVEEVSHVEKVADHRYVWTGGPVDEDGPTSTPPGDSWNRTNGNGNGTEPLGVAFKKGESGSNASWFFWTTKEITVIDVQHKDAVGEPTVRVMTDPGQPRVDAVTCTEHVRWIVPASAGNPTTQAGQPQTFPQQLLVGDLSCGRWSQDDTYVLHNAADKALFDSLGDTLTWVNGHPEDSAIYQSHSFTYGGDCATPVTADLNLTYMTACAPDSTNTWRIRNSSEFAIHYRLFYAGVDDPVATGTAEPGDTFINLARVQATAILKWGGGDSGVIAGQKTKASGNDENCHVALGTPDVTPQICTVTDTGQSFTGGTVTLPADIKGITYTIEGGEVSGLAPGDYTVTATPRGNAILTPSDGWTVNAYGTATYTVTIGAADDCAVQPVPSVTYTDWADGAYGCDDTTVVQTRTATTTPWILVDNTWVLDAENAVTVTETQTRDLTSDEQTVCPPGMIAIPAAPTVVPPTCTADGSATAVNGEHYTWDKTSFGPGSWTATATAADGY